MSYVKIRAKAITATDQLSKNILKNVCSKYLLILILVAATLSISCMFIFLYF